MEPPSRREPIVSRDELEATVAARRELGQELEPELIESFVERIEQRLEARYGKAERRRRDSGPSFALALISLGVSVPLTAIALTTGGLVALVVVWSAIVLVNAIYARSA